MTPRREETPRDLAFVSNESLARSSGLDLFRFGRGFRSFTRELSRPGRAWAGSGRGVTLPAALAVSSFATPLLAVLLDGLHGCCAELMVFLHELDELGAQGLPRALEQRVDLVTSRLSCPATLADRLHQDLDVG